MSDEGDPKPEPAPAPAETVTQAVSRLAVALDERKRRAARVLLHVRYVFGYLASGFLVSVPISLGSRIGSGIEPVEALKEIALSAVYGVVLLVPFFALIPFSRIDWKNMRVPEFQLFELAVTRTATFVALGMLLLSVQLRATQLRVFSMLAEPRVVWTVLILMLFGWGRIKVQTKLFPEFYA